MFERRAHPENAVLLLDFFVGDAVIIGISATRRDAQLVENLARAVEVKIFSAAHPFGDFLNNPPIGLGFARRVNRLVDFHDARFRVGRHAFVFRPRRAGQNDIGVARGFAHKEIDVDVKFQAFERLTDFVRVR